MASGDSLAIIRDPALANTPPASNPMTPDQRNNHWVLDADASTNESAVFSFYMPKQYGGNGIHVDVLFAMSTATSGDVDVDAAIERIGEEQQDIDSDGFAAAKSVDNTTVPGTSGHTKKIRISFSNSEIDGLLAGERGRLKITRDAASDTATGDMEFLGIHAEEQ